MSEEQAPAPAAPRLPPLPRPLDALAAVANLRAAHPGCEHAQAAADALYAYALRHNQTLADRATAMAQREAAAREIAERQAR